MNNYSKPPSGEECPADYKAVIDAMPHEEMCRKWRFAALGDPLLQGAVGAYFTDRLFNHFGGFTPAISKRLGWDDK